MKYRIAMWASAGFLVAGFWALYLVSKAPMPITSVDPLLTLIRLTCPIVSVSFYFHSPLGVSWSLLANAASYAMLGLIAEIFRRQLKPAE